MSSASSAAFSIRRAMPGDEPAILAMIHALAVFEALEHELALDAEGLSAALFGPEAFAGALLAEGAGNGAETLGYVLYFKSFSTFLCRPGLYLEDLFVVPAARGRGIGLTLLRGVCAEAARKGYPRVEWSVLDWNSAAIAFYERLGAVHQPEWQRFRIDGAALQKVAAPMDAASE